MWLRGFRTYTSAVGGVLVSIGAGITAYQSHDWQALLMAGSAALVSMAQIFQRAATRGYDRPDPDPYEEDDVLPMNGGAQ